jgi:hypothetical protein
MVASFARGRPAVTGRRRTASIADARAVPSVSLSTGSPVKLDKIAADPKIDEHPLGMLATLTLR